MQNDITLLSLQPKLALDEGLQRGLALTPAESLVEPNYFTGLLISGHHKLALPTFNTPPDIPASAATNISLTLDTPITSYIDSQSDRDWFRFEIDQGQTFQFEISSEYFSNISLNVYASNGDFFRLATETSIENSQNIARFSPETSGTYYLEMSYLSATLPTSAYTVNMTEIQENEANYISLGSSLNVNEAYIGRIDYFGDEDFFRFFAQDTTPLFIALDTAQMRLRMDVVDLNGGRIAWTESEYNGQTGIFFETPTNGEFGLHLYGLNASEVPADYTISLIEIFDDAPASPNTTLNASIGTITPVSADFNQDEDWIAINVQAGQTLAFVRFSDAISTNNGFFHIYDVQGNLIADARDTFGGDASILHTFDAAGTYYISSRIFSRTGDYSIFVGDSIIEASAGNSQVWGTSLDDVIFGTDQSALTFSGGLGNDYIFGGREDDVFLADLGSDSYLGGLGRDTADYSASDTGIFLEFNYTNVGMGRGGFAEGDTLHSIEIVNGSNFADTLIFLGGNSMRLNGGGGNDLISGARVMDGGSGDDVIIDRSGDNGLFGGSGSDRFVFNAQPGFDIIYDFEPHDIIVLEISPYTSLSELRAMMYQAADGVVIQIEGIFGSITIEGIEIRDLSLENFEFTGIEEDSPGPFLDPADIIYPEKTGSSPSTSTGKSPVLVSEVLDDFDDAPNMPELSTLLVHVDDPREYLFAPSDFENPYDFWDVNVNPDFGL